MRIRTFDEVIDSFDETVARLLARTRRGFPAFPDEHDEVFAMLSTTPAHQLHVHREEAISLFSHLTRAHQFRLVTPDFDREDRMSRLRLLVDGHPRRSAVDKPAQESFWDSVLVTSTM
jgi:hypothetical protein